MNVRWALSSLAVMTLLLPQVHAAMPLVPVETRAAAITLASDTTKPVYRKSAPRGATYQGYPCSQTRKTG